MNMYLLGQKISTTVVYKSVFCSFLHTDNGCNMYLPIYLLWTTDFSLPRLPLRFSSLSNHVIFELFVRYFFRVCLGFFYSFNLGLCFGICSRFSHLLNFCSFLFFCFFLGICSSLSVSSSFFFCLNLYF